MATLQGRAVQRRRGRPPKPGGRRHGSIAGYTSEWLGSTPAGRRPRTDSPCVHRGRAGQETTAEPASIGTSSPATDRASGSEKFEVLLFSLDDGGGRRGRARSQDHCTKELVQNPLYLILIKCTVENAGAIGVPGCPGDSSRPSRLTRFSCLAGLEWPVVLT